MGVIRRKTINRVRRKRRGDFATAIRLVRARRNQKECDRRGETSVALDESKGSPGRGMELISIDVEKNKELLDLKPLRVSATRRQLVFRETLLAIRGTWLRISQTGA